MTATITISCPERQTVALHASDTRLSRPVRSARRISAAFGGELLTGLPYIWVNGSFQG